MVIIALLFTLNIQLYIYILTDIYLFALILILLQVAYKP